MPPTRSFQDIVMQAILYIYCRTRAHAVEALYSEVNELKK